MNKHIIFLYILSLLTVATGCREDELVVPTELSLIHI